MSAAGRQRSSAAGNGLVRIEAPLCLAVIAGVAALAAPGALAGPRNASSRAAPLLRSGFESGFKSWFPINGVALSIDKAVAHGGGGSLRVRLTRPADAGVYFAAFGNGLPRARFSASVWARGSGPAVGKRLRLQLNQAVGSAPPHPIGGTAVGWARLTGRWQLLSVAGRIDGDVPALVVPIVVLEHGVTRSVVHLDDFVLRGSGGQSFVPLQVSPRHVRNRLGWPQSSAIWAAAAAAAFCVFRLRRGLGS